MKIMSPPSTSAFPDGQGSSMTNPTADDVDRIGRMKDISRESRFVFRNLAEHQLRRELKEIAIADHCQEPIRNFAECSQAAGLLVVWNCNALFKKVNECMTIHNGEEAWQQYKSKHAAEIEKRAKMGQE
jgi:Cytochrome c oxidase biogenesis protein Cmc1 like